MVQQKQKAQLCFPQFINQYLKEEVQQLLLL